MRIRGISAAALWLGLVLSVPAMADPPNAQMAAAPSSGSTEPAVARHAATPQYASPTFNQERHARMVSFTAALEAVRNGQVDSAYKHYGSRLVIFYLRLRDGSLIGAVPANSAEIEKALGTAGVELTVEDGDYMAEAVQWVSFLSSLFFLVLIAVMGWSLARKFVGSPARRLVRRRRGRKITFADVAGQDEAKLELREIVEFMRDPGKFRTLGARVPCGVLLSGPPGNGKTLLAKAIADEAGVAFMQVSGSEFLEMFAGLGARRVRKMFKAARRHRQGCIIFIDEIEVMGGHRGRGQGSDVQGERDQILNQLLVELDGIESRGRIILICATNRPEMLDPALIRPGRLDRHVYVPPPDKVGRKKILDIHVKGVPLAKEVLTRMIARATPGFSGADLANLVNEAAILAGRKGLVALDMECFYLARDKILMGPARSGASVDPEDRAIAAHHEAGHAMAAIRTPGADPVHKATVLPRGEALGMVMQLPERDRRMQSRAKLDADLVVLMAGRAAEELIYGERNVTGGASQDIKEATRIARAMIGRLGMDQRFGCMDYLGDDIRGGAAAERTLADLDMAVQAKIRAAYLQARSLLQAEMEGLKDVAAELLERETMSGSEIEAVLDAALGRRKTGPEAG